MENYNLHTRIEETLNSLNDIQRAEANPFMLTRVLEKMRTNTYNLVKPVLIWQTAVSLFVIVSLNVLIGVYSFKQTPEHAIPVESGYFSNHLYNY